MDIQPENIVSYRIPGTNKIWIGKVLAYVNNKLQVSILNAGYEGLDEWIDLNFVIGVCDVISEDDTKLNRL